MPIRRIKRRDRLLAECRARICGRHYYAVYLWQSRDAMIADGLSKDGDWSDGCIGVCCHEPARIRIAMDGTETRVDRPRLGEIHFISRRWDVEIVAHEVAHATLNSCRITGPSLSEVDSQEPFASEETFCYRLGEMVAAVYAWLNTADA